MIHVLTIAGKVRHKGTLKAMLGLQERFESLDFDISNYDEFISARKIREMLENGSPNSQTKSPTMSKKQLNAKQKAKPSPKQTYITENDLPKVPYRIDDGVTAEAFRFLENANVLAQMQHLMIFAQQNNQMSGQAALQRYSETNQSGQLQIHQINQLNNFAAAQQGHPQLQFPPGANGFQQNPGFPMRHPSMGNHFVSPANNLGIAPTNLTGSPHIRPGGSPGQPGLPPHMQGVPMATQMAAQHSSQGTNSGAASSNASPNTANRKRRASQAEAGNGPQVNGVTDKQAKTTPKIGGQNQKRPRAA